LGEKKSDEKSEETEGVCIEIHWGDSEAFRSSSGGVNTHCGDTN